MKIHPFLPAGLLLALVACRPPETRVPAAADDWAASTLKSLDLRQKAAQMVMVRSFGHYLHPRSPDYLELLSEVRDLEVGGLVVFSSSLESLPRLLDRLQQEAALPLLVAADLERGMAFRVKEGTVPLPYAMAIGATRSEEMARFTGEVTAREGRALGIHWALAPVADVNVNPANPVIHIRSYGEDPELVSRLSAAFIRGAHDGGMMATAKHFPGHGDTTVDSHLALPTVAADLDRLEAVELAPFRRAIEAGVDSVMTGHLAVPALDDSSAPATLSPAILDGLLRRRMGFDGLIVTDAMEMKGVGGVWAGAAAVAAVKAGADMVLLPPDARVAIQSLVRAVEEGELSEARLDASVRRILEAKARLGLHRGRRVDAGAVAEQVADPQDVEKAMAAARASITVVRNRGDVLPLRAEEPLRLLHVTLSSSFLGARFGGLPKDPLAGRGVAVTRHDVGPDASPETIDEIAAAAAGATHIVVASALRSAVVKPSHARLLERLAAIGPPVVFISFGSPYLLAEIPDVAVYVCTYGTAASSLHAALGALFGEYPVRGKLPVSLPGLYPYGHGLEIPRHEMTLRPAAADAADLSEVDRVLDSFVREKAFPGGVVAVGHRGELVHLRPFGRQTYDEGAAPVTAETIYDLASLTKVIATTTMAMILLDENRLDLDATVESYLPLFRGAGKEKVTVRQLLTHSSGVDWWAPLYKEAQGQEAFLERIQAMDLAYEPGSDTKYSDLGLMLLGEILERASGQSLDDFAGERVFEPLGMNDTFYRPGKELLPRIAPTEFDEWRGRVVHGEVHDENAFGLGGVAPHAGLFSTAGDLARFAEMIVNGGVFEHRRLGSREPVESFTKRAGVPDSSLGLGCDTNSAVGSSAGTLFSPDSFGHTGFTGTSIWIDPERQLFLILLTNRVHPTRDNKLIRKVRPAVADAVVRALEPVVQIGLERLDDAQLAGKRLGLVVHAASVTADGRHAIDVTRDLGLDVVRLFSPEHGLRGRAAAGQNVESGRDPVSGLPVVSLYGARRKPAPSDLEGLDALVFDLQGAGVRFYTYVSTLILCLEAAAEAGIELVVLDRPNPLGGMRVEGPVSAPRDQVTASFVNLAPGPLVHGLTLGEMARYVNSRMEEPARLTVVPMQGWKREMVWADTGRPWVSPSPNLRSAEAALAYPGVGLLEATNLSEGRGTEVPFLRLGAPWLDVGRLQVEVPGFELTASSFIPEGSSAAPRPKYLDEDCAGVRVRVSDPATAAPYRLGVTLLVALSRQDGFAWKDGGAVLVRLLGTPRLFADLERGASVDEIVAADAADHAAWREARRVALLY